MRLRLIASALCLAPMFFEPEGKSGGGSSGATLKDQLTAAETARDVETIIREVRDAIIPGSPFSQDAAALAHLDFTFIPALIAALTKG